MWVEEEVEGRPPSIFRCEMREREWTKYSEKDNESEWNADIKWKICTYATRHDRNQMDKTQCNKVHTFTRFAGARVTQNTRNKGIIKNWIRECDQNCQNLCIIHPDGLNEWNMFNAFCFIRVVLFW